MRNLFMSAGVVTSIILCIIGIVKLPFKNFKSTHKRGYKAIFTGLSFILSLGLSILNQLYILDGQLISVEFATLLSVVFAGVFWGYGGVYEGLGLKELVKKIIENIKVARNLSQNKKAVEYLNKLDNIEEAIKILEERRDNQNNDINKVREV